MGNDLLIATLAIETGKEPNWEAARNRVRTMGDSELTEAMEQWNGEALLDDDGNLNREHAVAELLELVRLTEEAVGSEHRHLYATEYIVPGWTVWLTGGDSWGDSPSDEFDLFNTFISAGYPDETLAQAAGFAHRFVEPTVAS